MITQTLDLNLIPGRVLPMVNVSQYDKDSRTLEFTIYNGDQSFDLTGLSAYIQGLKPDGHGFNYSANISAGKITADITEQMTAVSGRVMCEVIIMDGTDRIGTGNFILNVEAAAMPDGSNMSESEYSYVQELLEEAQEIVDGAEQYVEDAEAWANGTRDGQAIPATDQAYQKNSKYWSEQSDTYAQQSSGYSEDAEAWAVGTRNGTPVPSGSPEYENNAAYWANEARNVAQQTTYTEQDDSLALAPTSAGNALPLTIYGQSTQNGTPTPSAPVAIESASADFKCVGKNLNSYPYNQTTKTQNGITFTDNGDGTITANGTATNDTYFACHSRLVTEANGLVVPNGTYIFNGCQTGGNDTVGGTYAIMLERTYNGASNRLGTDIGNGATITLNGDDYFDDKVQFQISIIIRNGATVNNVTFKPMLRLVSVADATYEPYKHTDITTSQTLRSIEVTSSDPYNLVKDGHYYIADTIDWDEVDGYTLTKRVNVGTLNGTEQGWALPSDRKTQYGYSFKLNPYDAVLTGITPTSVNTFDLFTNEFRCKELKGGQFIYGSNSTADWGSGTYRTSGNVWISIGAQDMATLGISDINTFKSWLGLNNVTVLYPITPIKTSITSAQAKALLSMRTYDESTSIDAVNAPAPVLELEYAKTRTPALALTGHNMAHINAIDIGDM